MPVTQKTQKALPNYLKPAREVFKFPKFKKASEALAAALEIVSTQGRWIQNSLAAALEQDAIDSFLQGELKLTPSESLNYMDGLLSQHPKNCPTKAKNAHAFCALGHCSL